MEPITCNEMRWSLRGTAGFRGSMRYYEGISKAAFKAWISNFQILTTIKNESSANIYLDYCQERVTELHEASWSFYSSFLKLRRDHMVTHILYVPTSCMCQRHHTVNTTNPYWSVIPNKSSLTRLSTAVLWLQNSASCLENIMWHMAIICNNVDKLQYKRKWTPNAD